MLLDGARPRNVSRAIREINAFEWEGDFKPLARQALKELMENRLDQELADYLGVSRYEHARDRHDYRNAHYLRHLLTEMGDIELLVPRSRKVKFPSKLFDRYARRCRSVDRVLLACFCLGLSTRKAAAVLAPVLEEKVSVSTISHIARDLDQEVSRYHGRVLEDKYQYLFFDGVVLKSKGAVKVQKKVLLCAFGITVEGRHEMIDFYPAASESGACWEAFLGDLYKRGLKGDRCELIATDGGTGLHQGLQIVYPRSFCSAAGPTRPETSWTKSKRKISRRSKTR